MKEKIYIKNKIKNKNLQVQMQWSFSINIFDVRPSASNGASDVVL
jgi:hypothetical protein